MSTEHIFLHLHGQKLIKRKNKIRIINFKYKIKKCIRYFYAFCRLDANINIFLCPSFSDVMRIDKKVFCKIRKEKFIDVILPKRQTGNLYLPKKDKILYKLIETWF